MALECDVEGYSPPKVEWLKDGQPIIENRHLRLYFDGSTAMLKIYEAHPDHGGEYICRATNSAGSVECQCLLFIDSKQMETCNKK